MTDSEKLDQIKLQLNFAQNLLTSRLAGHERLLLENIGFGAHTTGGLGGTVYVVTTLNDSGAGSLREALMSPEPLWIRFGVSGTITLSSEIYPKSNKTIDGRGQDITITGHGIIVRHGEQNFIFNNLKFTATADDAIGVFNGCKNIWVHHCSLSNGGDGLIDCTVNCTGVTVSWCHLKNHERCMLMGASGQLDEIKMRVTLHHNWYEDVESRLPLITDGWAHSFNNIFNWINGAAIQSTWDADMISENDVAAPHSTVGQNCFKKSDGGKSKVINPVLVPFEGQPITVPVDDPDLFNPKDYYDYIPDVPDMNWYNDMITKVGWQNVPFPV